MICQWLYRVEDGGEVRWEREWGEKGERGRDKEKEGWEEIRIAENREGAKVRVKEWEWEWEDFHEMSLTV